MLFALVYSCLRLFLDVADVRLRLNNPEAELLLLRHELRVLRRQINRPHRTPADRVGMAVFNRLVSRPALGGLVEPETVLGWHRELVRTNSGCALRTPDCLVSRCPQGIPRVDSEG